METTTNGVEQKAGWNEVMGASAENERKAGERPPREFEESLPCVLSETEMAAIARQTGTIRATRRDIETKLKMLKDRYKAQLDTLDSTLEELGEKAEQGAENRAVKCREDYLYETGNVRTTRLDTGEVIRERAMLASERQLPLKGVQATFADVESEDDISDEDEEILASGDLEASVDEAIGDIGDPDALIAASGGEPAPKKRGRKASEA